MKGSVSFRRDERHGWVIESPEERIDEGEVLWVSTKSGDHKPVYGTVTFVPAKVCPPGTDDGDPVVRLVGGTGQLDWQVAASELRRVIHELAWVAGTRKSGRSSLKAGPLRVDVELGVPGPVDDELADRIEWCIVETLDNLREEVASMEKARAEAASGIEDLPRRPEIVQPGEPWLDESRGVVAVWFHHPTDPSDYIEEEVEVTRSNREGR